MRLSWTRWLRMHHNYGRDSKSTARAVRRARKKRIKRRMAKAEAQDYG